MWLKTRVLFFVIIIFSSTVFAAAKPPKDESSNVRPWSGKKGVALAPVSNIQIEMPDHELHNFGEDFQAILTTQLVQSGKYLVTDAERAVLGSRFSSLSLSEKEFRWDGSVTPAAILSLQVKAMSFTTGSRGDRFFYGFDERLKNSFNDGSGEKQNEFPLRPFIPNEPGWFGADFRQKGLAPLDSRSGLDLGEGFGFDFLFAFLNVKYARYHSELRLDLQIDVPLPEGMSANSRETREIQVSGDGFFFDVAAAYDAYSAGITVARKDAMNQALRNAVSATYSALERAIDPLPRLARVDAVLPDGTVLLGTGLEAEIPSGMYFQDVQRPDVVIQVTQSGLSGAVGRVIRGDVAQVQAGEYTREVEDISEPELRVQTHSLAERAVPSVSEVIRLPDQNFGASDLSGLVPVITRGQAVLKSIVGLIFLPYRIWRYFAYDQAYHKSADANPVSRPASSAPEVLVAVLDSGVDYNHPAIHDSIWLNPDFSVDANGRKDRYGWDFISNDSRPYDDGYHGTQVSSVILDTNPNVKIMPLKIFNPWGITSSAAILAAFHYASDHGAQVIVCAWATFHHSEALEQGVAYAQEKSVPVVTVVGDSGIFQGNYPSYPAAFRDRYSLLIPVVGVSASDRPLSVSGALKGVIAARAEGIPVAEPRLGQAKETSAAVAAAQVAGGLSRYWKPEQSADDWVAEFLADAELLPTLEAAVEKGRRMRGP